MRALLALAVMAIPCMAIAEKHAFVLSNGEYTELSDLRNTHADAQAYATAFENLGYAVEAYRDLDRTGTMRAFLGFLDKVAPGDEVVFVYSGHGWSNGATNYIVPTNVPRQAPQHEGVLEFETVPIQNGITGLLDLLAQKKTDLTIAIIDACRNNPFAPPPGRKSFGVTRGLQVAPSSQGSFVIYSAGQGQEALDRLPSDDADQRLSVFTRNFVDHLKPGIYLHEAVLNARVRTTEQANSVGHRQTPAYYDQTVQRVCLAGDCSVKPVVNQCDALWQAAEKSAACYGYEAYLNECGTHIFASVAGAFVQKQCTAPDVAVTDPNEHPDALACLGLAMHPDQKGIRGAAAELIGTHVYNVWPEEALPACTLAHDAFPEFLPLQVALAQALESKAAEDGGDMAKAVALYQSAAEAGDAAAAMSMARLTSEGIGVAQSDSQATQWYRQAAAGGVGLAQRKLGQMYDRGTGGVAQDLDEAALWFRKAADNGDDVAQAYVGWSYKVGRGVAKNPERAAEWFQLAVDQGHRGAHFMLGDLYYEGEGKEKNYPKAAELYRVAAESGHAEAQLALGWMYASGEGLDQSDKDAAHWYERAAEQGEASAQFHLSILYFEGRGVPKDLERAAHWSRQAAEQDITTAQANLGLMYKNGYGVAQDFAQAVQWYTRAAKAGDANAQLDLGWLHESGQGTPQDYTIAAQWYEKAATQGDPIAQTNLGWLYFKGLGVKRNRRTARDWIEQAAKQGDDRATELMRKHFPFYKYN